MADEGHSEKLVDLQMEKPTKTANNPESRIEEISAPNEIRSLTDDTLREDSNLSNLKITRLVKTVSRPFSIDKSNLTTTQETLDQVKEKLINLHNILLTYESSDSEQTKKCPSSKNCVTNKDSKLNIDVKENLSKEIKNCNDSEKFENLAQTSSSSVESDSNLSDTPNKTVIHNPNYNPVNFSDFDSEDEKTEKFLETESKISTNTFTKIESKSNLSNVKSELLETFKANLNNDRITSQIANNTNYKLEENFIPMDTSEDQFSQSSSQIEFLDEIFDNQLPTFSQIKNTIIPEIKLKVDEENLKKLGTIKNIPKYLEANNKSENETKKDNIQKIKEIDFEREIDNFQTLDVLPEEQSASSLTETASKKSDEDQNLGENSKTLLSSASSEYFSFVNLTHKEKMDKNFKNELWENRNELIDQSTINETENNDQELVKSGYNKIMYLKKENDYQTRKQETNKETEDKEIINQKDTEIKEKSKMEYQIESVPINYKLDSEIKRLNRNFTSASDSSSDESLTQFIRELTSDKIKSTQVFKETKFSLNFIKSHEKLFNIEEGQEQESVLSLQRCPGSISITDNESTENVLKCLNNDSLLNSKTNNSTEIKANFKNDKNKTDELKEIGNINVNKDETKVNKKIIDENSTEKIENKSITAILETKKESKELLEAKNKDFVNFDNKSEDQEKIDNSLSNLISNPSSTLYFTLSPSDGKSDINLLTIPISKTNSKSQESIFQNSNELPENKEEAKIYVNEQEGKINVKKCKQSTEVMLIDLSDNNSSKLIKSEIKNVSKIEKLNILDEIFEKKDNAKFENECLIPKKIQSINDLRADNNNIEFETNNQNMSGNILIKKSTNDSLTKKMEISETNKFSHCTSAPVLQREETKKNSNLNLEKPKNNTEMSAHPMKNSTKRDEFVEKFVDKRGTNKLTENSSTKQLRTKSFLNLNLSKGKSENSLQRRSRSFASPRMIQTFLDSNRNANNDLENINNEKRRVTSRTSLKSMESQKSSRSCIPILKSRLENLRKHEPKSRYRSPTRGPLTINPAPDELDLQDTNYFNNEINVPKKNNNEKSFGDNTGQVINLPKHPKPDEKTVIYINIMNGQDQSTRKVVNPKKFLEFMKDREMNIDKEKRENFQFPNSIPERNESSLKKNNPSKFLFHVEQKEREVSVKPSVMDNSTSISDFPQFCNSGNKFKIFDVPEELTKEEYIHLLDLLNQDPNLEQLRKMHTLCSKLGLGFQE